MLDNLNKKLNINFQEEAENVKNEISKVEEKKNEIAKKVENTQLAPITFEDKEYLLLEIRKLIASTGRILEKLEQDIKIGSPPRMYEVYSALTNAKVNQLRELRELNKMIMDMQFFADPQGKNDSKSEKDEVTMKTSDLLKFVKEAQKQNQLNSVDAEFQVLDDCDEPKSEKE